MRKYWINTRYNFDNDYSIVYTETVQQENRAYFEGYERITRKDAFALCARARANKRRHGETIGRIDEKPCTPFLIHKNGYTREYFN